MHEEVDHILATIWHASLGIWRLNLRSLQDFVNKDQFLKKKMIILINLKALKEENIMIIRFDYKLKSIQRTDALKILPKLFMAEEKRL